MHKIKTKFISAARARHCSVRVAFGLFSLHHRLFSNNTSLCLIISRLSQDDVVQNNFRHFEPAL